MEVDGDEEQPPTAVHIKLGFSFVERDERDGKVRERFPPICNSNQGFISVYPEFLSLMLFQCEEEKDYT